MRAQLLLPLVLLCGLSAAAATPPTAESPADRGAPPAPHCFDARDVIEARQSDERTLAVRLRDESRYRVELADACPDALFAERARLVSPQGWICGSNDEHVEADGRRCALSGLARIDAREFADHALRSRRAVPRSDAAEMETIRVTARRGRGFGGTTAFCLDTRHMRGWSEDGNDLIVEVSPMRSGGHRYYRVEFAGGCTEMIAMDILQLDSPIGGSAFCGNPGDRALFSRSSGGAGGGLGAGFSRRITETSLAAKAGCAVSRVYPILPDERRETSAR